MMRFIVVLFIPLIAWSISTGVHWFEEREFFWFGLAVGNVILLGILMAKILLFN